MIVKSNVKLGEMIAKVRHFLVKEIKSMAGLDKAMNGFGNEHN